MTGAFAAVARKEMRALLPLWAATAVTLAADPFARGTGVYSLFPVGMFAYIVGSLALGAHAIGHEYTSRTLATLLVQPWKRSSMLLAKTAVLAAMLLTLAVIAWLLLFHTTRPTARDFPPLPTLFLPLFGGLCVAPYLTMRWRSQMAGVVFTSAIPGVTYIGVLLAGMGVYGSESDAAEKLATAVWPPAMLIFAAAGAVLSARSFMRLQDTGGGGEELRLPRWLLFVDRNPARPPLWMLVKKELRLQQMTFAMPVLFAGIWLALTIAGRLNPEFGHDFPIRGVALLYFALLPLLIGSLASAQERQFGTLESQAMLPVSFAQQWAVKAGVVLTLALVLGVLLPWFFFVPPHAPRQVVGVPMLGILFLTTWSLYLSSCSPSGVIALALLLPASAAVIVAVRGIDAFVDSFGFAPALPPGPPDPVTLATLGTPLAIALVVFAGRNHRSAERKFMQLAAQALTLLAICGVTDLLLRLLS